jgi:hypothetical protein
LLSLFEVLCVRDSKLLLGLVNNGGCKVVTVSIPQVVRDRDAATHDTKRMRVPSLAKLSLP